MKILGMLFLLIVNFLPLSIQADVLNQTVTVRKPTQKSRVYLLKTPEKEIIGNQKEFLGNGLRDTQIKLYLYGHEGKTIDWIEITALDEKGFIWDTIPRNQHWLIAVIVNKVIMNHPNGSFSYKVNTDPLILDLYFQDNESIRKGGTNLEVALGFIDGEILTLPVESEK